MIYEKLSPRLKSIRDMSNHYLFCRYKVQLEQYIAAHKKNVIGNTPEIIIKKLRIFFPEMENILNEIEKL